MYCNIMQDDPLWHQADDDKYEDEGAGELYNFAQECLDRWVVALCNAVTSLGFNEGCRGAVQLNAGVLGVVGGGVV